MKHEYFIVQILAMLTSDVSCILTQKHRYIFICGTFYMYMMLNVTTIVYMTGLYHPTGASVNKKVLSPESHWKRTV